MVEKATTRKELIEGLEALRVIEITARDAYKMDTITFRNFKIIDTIKKIKTDEDRHIELIEELLNLLTHTTTYRQPLKDFKFDFPDI